MSAEEPSEVIAKMAYKVVNVFHDRSTNYDEGESLARVHGIECARAMTRSEDEIVEVARDADAIIGAFSGVIQRLSRSTIKQLPKVRHIAVLGVGFDAVDLAAATENGVCVSNCADYGLEELANHTIMLLLSLSRKLVPTVDAVRSGKWQGHGHHAIRKEIMPPLPRLSRQTLGILGFGNTASLVVPRAQAFGLRVIAHSTHASDDQLRRLGAEPVDLDTLLAESDFISLHAALRPENRHIINKETICKMKRGVFLINTARGGLVDEQALYDGLRQGIVAGAGLDVMEPEPPNLDNPLLHAPNVIITAHVGSYSKDSQRAATRIPYEEVVRVSQGGFPRELTFCNPAVKERFLAKWGRNPVTNELKTTP